MRTSTGKSRGRMGDSILSVINFPCLHDEDMFSRLFFISTSKKFKSQTNSFFNLNIEKFQVRSQLINIRIRDRIFRLQFYFQLNFNQENDSCQIYLIWRGGKGFLNSFSFTVIICNHMANAFGNPKVYENNLIACQ